MSQMVLPQNLPNKAPTESSNVPGPSRTGSEKSGESSFDAVSRLEKKQQAGKSEQADSKAAKNESKNAGAEKPAADQNESADGQTPAAEIPNEETGQKLAADGLSAENHGAAVGLVLDEPLIENVPVTFAGLQSLVVPTQSPDAALATATTGANATPTNAQGLPFVQGSIMSMNGLSAGKNGVITVQTPGQTGSTSGGALAETLLAGVTADGAKASDSPMLQNAIRFQGALESAGAQANSVNTPKMAPDAPVLRGYTTSIDVPVSHAEWGDKVAGKLTWLTARNMSVAEIHLTPPDMGPMEVKVQVQQDQANITVHSANPAVRDQLELHSHRLRDMLSEQGFSLEQFDVSDSGRDQAGDGDAAGGDQTGQSMMADAEQEDAANELRSLDLTWKGEVDIFA